MTRTIQCPSCQEEENLRGEMTPEGVRIACETCGVSWLRDSIPDRCATCDGDEVEERTRALTQYSRGTQLSIVGLGAIKLCRRCDASMIAWSESGRPVPFEYKAAAMDPQAGAERSCRSDDGDVLITP
jgi:hypothetical protein